MDTLILVVATEMEREMRGRERESQMREEESKHETVVFFFF
jgi:hypothetical protein